MRQSREFWLTRDGAKGDVPNASFLWEKKPRCNKSGTFWRMGGTRIHLCGTLYPNIALKRKGIKKVKITIEDAK